MKLLALLLLVVVVSKVTAMPQNKPWSRPVLYRIQEDESSEESEDEVQDDDASVEDEEPPPQFSKLFPAAPQQSVRGPGAGAPNPFADVSREIQKSGWNPPPPKRRQRLQSRNRAEYLDDVPRYRALFRMAEESEEEEDDEEAEDDDPFPPAMDKMFPDLPPGSGQSAPPSGAASGQRRYSGPSQGGPQGGPPSGAQGLRRGPPPNIGSQRRQFRSGVVPGPISYVRRQQPVYAPVRPQMPYRYAAGQYMYRPPVYPQRQVPYNRVPVNYYMQRQPMQPYNRRLYQVPVSMSVPARRYQSPAVMRRPSYFRSYRNRY